MAVDELVVRADSAQGSTQEPNRPRPAQWVTLLAVGFVLQVAWRLYLAWPMVGPVAHADEDGYLFVARVVGGGADAILPGWSIMRPIGYPLLLSPIHWFVEEPTAVYRGVHIVNAVLMALLFPLGYQVARRLFGVAQWPAVALAFVVATLPSAVFFSQFALTDALLPTLVLLFLLAVHGMVAAGSGAATPAEARTAAWAGILAGAVAGYAANTHVRGLVMVVALGVLVGLGWWRGWLSWRTATACAAALTVVFGAGKLANSWLEERMFDAGSFEVGGRVFERLTSVQGAAGVVVDAGGQLWHLSTSTYGLGAVGLVATGFALWRREWPRPTRIVLALALAMTVGIALATATGIPYETEKRINNHVYGRYVAIFVAFWVIVGVVSLIRATTQRAVRLAVWSAVLILGTLTATVLFWGERMRTGAYVNFDSPELSFLTGNWQYLRYYRVTAIALALLVVLAVLLSTWPVVTRVGARWWRERGGVSMLATAALAAVMLVNLVAMVRITQKITVEWTRRDYHSAAVDLREAGVGPGDTIVQATSVSWMLVLRHQHEVYWRGLPTFDPTVGLPPERPTYVIASTGTGKPTDWYGWDFGYEEVARFKDAYAGTCVVWRLQQPSPPAS